MSYLTQEPRVIKGMNELKLSKEDREILKHSEVSNLKFEIGRRKNE